MSDSLRQQSMDVCVELWHLASLSKAFCSSCSEPLVCAQSALGVRTGTPAATHALASALADA